MIIQKKMIVREPVGFGRKHTECDVPEIRYNDIELYAMLDVDVPVVDSLKHADEFAVKVQEALDMKIDAIKDSDDYKEYLTKIDCSKCGIYNSCTEEDKQNGKN